MYVPMLYVVLVLCSDAEPAAGRVRDAHRFEKVFNVALLV